MAHHLPSPPQTPSRTTPNNIPASPSPRLARIVAYDPSGSSPRVTFKNNWPLTPKGGSDAIKRVGPGGDVLIYDESTDPVRFVEGLAGFMWYTGLEGVVMRKTGDVHKKLRQTIGVQLGRLLEKLEGEGVEGEEGFGDETFLQTRLVDAEMQTEELEAPANDSETQTEDLEIQTEDSGTQTEDSAEGPREIETAAVIPPPEAPQTIRVKEQKPDLAVDPRPDLSVGGQPTRWNTLVIIHAIFILFFIFSQFAKHRTSSTLSELATAMSANAELTHRLQLAGAQLRDEIAEKALLRARIELFERNIVLETESGSEGEMNGKVENDSGSDDAMNLRSKLESASDSLVELAIQEGEVPAASSPTGTKQDVASPRESGADLDASVPTLGTPPLPANETVDDTSRGNGAERRTAEGHTTVQKRTRAGKWQESGQSSLIGSFEELVTALFSLAIGFLVRATDRTVQVSERLAKSPEHVRDAEAECEEEIPGGADGADFGLLQRAERADRLVQRAIAKVGRVQERVAGISV